MGYEAGKNRLECVGDVEEAADLIAYYCDQIERHTDSSNRWARWARAKRTSACCGLTECGRSSRRSIFRMALAAGPAGGALAAGNTVVFKPASDTPLLGEKLYRDDGRSRPAGRACSTSSPARARRPDRS